MARRGTKRVLLWVGLAALGSVLAGCSPWSPASTFEVGAVPAEVVDLAQDASCIFLISVAELGTRGSAGPFALDVDASAGTVSAPSVLESGRVAEVRLWAGTAAVGSTITLAITAQRDDEAHSALVTATVTEPVGVPDDRLETGATMRDAFIPWLADAHPELGIDVETVWTAVPLRPHILEVSYSMFLCEEWELVVWWHIMIPPYDWARMYLRRRTTEMVPSFGAEIASISAGHDPQTMIPPEEVWR
ncbi:MAG: hypothetical protein PHW86_00045 [Candidatus Bipolaricaulis sp.]|nr:hypothetical protein [Candidatus Bipolaricaulis sp.]